MFLATDDDHEPARVRQQGFERVMTTSLRRKAGREPGSGQLRDDSSPDRVVTAIRQGLMTGRFVPGQRLVEADIHQTLGVSRGPIREAMKRLSAEGVVTLQPHRGACIRALTRSDAVDLLQALEVIVGLAAQLAAQKIEGSGNQALLEARYRRLAELGPAADLVPQAIERTGFYEAIFKIADNRELANMNPMAPTLILRMQIHGYLSAEERGLQFSDYAHLYEAIRGARPGRASAVVRRHIRRSTQQILRLPDIAFTAYRCR